MLNNPTPTTLTIAAPKAVIVGLEGEILNAQEEKLFSDHNPLGFILFARNVKHPDQVKRLVKQLRHLSGRQDAPILIDQEGGRVARLRPPYFRKTFPAQKIAQLAEKHLEHAKESAYLSGKLMGLELASLGINVDCAPVADLLIDGAHSIIGDRSYGNTVSLIVALAGEVARGLADAGVVPIMKHIPGHGRALVDSHEELPEVIESYDILARHDFEVFKQLKFIPWAMTAHVVYRCLDVSHPATLSPRVIRYIRENLEYDGVIISDDLSMKALTGSFTNKAHQAVQAGCDLLLHCNGNMTEMSEVLEAAPLLGMEAARRLENGFQFIKPASVCDVLELENRLAELVGG
ncbi:MAG: beta-N-acetylhexosaminidase [Alphaproteobacteria bacterium]|nr:beta-N-acetylhexosaminidase [Alphaproteobacteria bacterium]